MHVARRTSVLIAGALVAAGVAALPAQAAETSTTLAVEGTLRVVVVDSFGGSPDSDHLYTVVTDDGAEIPVDLDEDAPANGRFVGELVVAGDVESALDDKDLLPREGSTIAEDSRAGRVAVAEAETQDAPLEVARSTVAPATAAAVTTPKAHQAYVAVMTGRGSVEETDAQVATLVDTMTSYWTTESNGAISSFTRPQAVQRFATTTAGDIASSCGMATDPEVVWNEAAGKAFPGVSFAAGTGRHLIVAMANECGNGSAGVTGVARVGDDFSSDGPMSVVLGSLGEQVGVHEIGHTFGLGHANLDACPSGAGCGSGVYFDLFSPMALAVGGSTFTPPALDSAFRSRLGVAPTVDVSPVTAAGGTARTFSLQPRSGASGLRGLDVIDPASGVHYFVDYRSGTGRDATTFYASSFTLGLSVPVTYDPGVTVSTIDAAGAISLQTQKAGSSAVGSFTAGQTFTSPTGATTIAVGAATPTSVAVSVTYAAQAPAPAAPASLSARTPRISGTAKVGRTLKVKVGTWSPRPSFRYQWFANGRKITKKGTKSSFKLTSKQKGKRITVRVTGSRSGYATISKTSKKTRKVAKK